jgi:hypothetical protein
MAIFLTKSSSWILTFWHIRRSDGSQSFDKCVPFVKWEENHWSCTDGIGKLRRRHLSPNKSFVFWTDFDKRVRRLIVEYPGIVRLSVRGFIGIDYSRTKESVISYSCVDLTTLLLPVPSPPTILWSCDWMDRHLHSKSDPKLRATIGVLFSSSVFWRRSRDFLSEFSVVFSINFGSYSNWCLQFLPPAHFVLYHISVSAEPRTIPGSSHNVNSRIIVKRPCRVRMRSDRRYREKARGRRDCQQKLESDPKLIENPQRTRIETARTTWKTHWKDEEFDHRSQFGPVTIDLRVRVDPDNPKFDRRRFKNADSDRHVLEKWSGWWRIDREMIALTSAGKSVKKFEFWEDVQFPVIAIGSFKKLSSFPLLRAGFFKHRETGELTDFKSEPRASPISQPARSRWNPSLHSLAPTPASPRSTIGFNMVFCPGKTQDLKGESIHRLN